MDDSRHGPCDDDFELVFVLLTCLVNTSEKQQANYLPALAAGYDFIKIRVDKLKKTCLNWPKYGEC